MRSRFFPYLRLNLKRAARFLPYVFGVGLLLFAVAAAFALSAADTHESGDAGERVSIGVVGNFEDPYISLVYFTLENVDNARFSLRLVPCESEEEALGLVREGKMRAALLIPQDFTAEITEGRHKPIRYVTAGADGIGSALAGELVRTFSRLVLDGENSVYGIQAYVRERFPSLSPSAVSNAMMKDYLAVMVGRDALFETEVIGVGAGLDFAAYYRAAMAVFFAMAWGVTAAPFFARRRTELKKSLSAAGLGAAGQTAAEFFAFFLLTLAGLWLLTLASFAVLRAGFPALSASVLPEGGVFAFLLPTLLPIFLFALMNFAVYEAARGSVSAILAQTLLSVGMGFLCGCFYPSSFLPPVMQRLGAVLPAGAAMRYLASPSLETALLPLGWAALFALFALLSRRAELKGDLA